MDEGKNMADDQTKRGPADAGRINMSEDYEIRYWTEKFGCTKQQLVSAVGSVWPNSNEGRGVPQAEIAVAIVKFATGTREENTGPV